VDPRSGEVVAEIPLEGLNDVFTQMAFGAGSVWVSSGYYGTLSRIDPQTGEVVANIDVDRGAGDIAADESSGAVWVAGVSTSDDERENEKLSRVDPETNRVAAGIPIPADAMSDGADG
jgi:streptogramin lyase